MSKAVGIGSDVVSEDLEEGGKTEERLEPENEIVKEVYELLTEEQWTRTTLENYSKSNFLSLDDIIKRANDEGVSKELRDFCIVHLDHSPKSIIALYVAGVLTYEQEIIDDSYIFQIIDFFKDDKKWLLIEFLALKVLSYGENSFALRVLEDVYAKTDNEEALIDVWKRISKIDYESGEVPYKLAEYFADGGNEEESILYYKMALKRFVRLEDSSLKSIEDIWYKLIDKVSAELHFFMQIEEELSKNNPNKASELLSALLIPYKEKDDYDNAIEILRKILECSPRDKEIRQELIDILKSKYNTHSQIENYLKKSGLINFSRPVAMALELFQRYIIFDIGSYVHHRSWGIGKVVDCKEDYLLIDFEKNKKNHKMSLKIVLASLKSIAEDHIWIRKQKGVEDFNSFDPKDIKNTLMVIFKSYNNTATMREIKKEMLDIIPASSWTKWWNKAKQVMKTSSLFGNSLSKRDLYFLRDKPLSFEEETYSNFQSDLSFDGRVSIVLDYIRHSDDINYEGFQYMLNYFVDIANNKAGVDDKNIKSFLLLRKVRKHNKDIIFELKLNPYEVVEERDVLIETYSSLTDSEFKRDLIGIVSKNDNEWYDVFLTMLKEVKATKSYNIIVGDLVKHAKIDILKEGLEYIIDRYRDNVASYLWISKLVMGDASLAEKLGFDRNRIIFNLFHCLDIVSKSLAAKKSIPHVNRKLFTQIIDFLIKENVFVNIIADIEEVEARKILAVLNSISLLDEKSRAYFSSNIFELFPSLLKDEVTTAEIHNFLVTNDSYIRKQKELQHIVNVEIPNNSKAIGIAKEYGDLRENAEYVAALEHQKHLQELYSRLTEDLSKIKILTKENVNKSVISPGTHVILTNLDTKKKEDYVILGEWESDMEKGIISYKSPFGKALLGNKKGKVVKFGYAGVEKKYKVNKIEIAKQLLSK